MGEYAGPKRSGGRNVVKNFNLATGSDLDLKGVCSGAKKSAWEARKIIQVEGSENLGFRQWQKESKGGNLKNARKVTG